MDQDRILTHSGFNGIFRIWLVLLGNSYSSTAKRWINKERHLTINSIKLNFLKKTGSMLYPSRDTQDVKKYSPRNTKDDESHKNPISIYQKITSRTR